MNVVDLIKKLLFIVFIFSATSAFAAGIGVYGNYSGGKAFFNKTLSEYSFVNGIDTNLTTHSAGGGLIFELFATSGKPVGFNYRLTIGVDHLFAQKNILENMNRFKLTNYLYLGIIKSRFINILFGPQFGGAYLFAKKSLLYPTISFQSWGGVSSVETGIISETIKIKSGGIHLGLSLNFDFIINDILSLFTQFEGNYTFYFSKLKSRGYSYIPSSLPMIPPLLPINISNKMENQSGVEGTISIGMMLNIKMNKNNENIGDTPK